MKRAQGGAPQSSTVHDKSCTDEWVEYGNSNKLYVGPVVQPRSHREKKTSCNKSQEYLHGKNRHYCGRGVHHFTQNKTSVAKNDGGQEKVQTYSLSVLHARGRSGRRLVSPAQEAPGFETLFVPFLTRTRSTSSFPRAVASGTEWNRWDDASASCTTAGDPKLIMYPNLARNDNILSFVASCDGCHIILVTFP